LCGDVLAGRYKLPSAKLRQVPEMLRTRARSTEQPPRLISLDCPCRHQGLDDTELLFFFVSYFYQCTCDVERLREYPAHIPKYGDQALHMVRGQVEETRLQFASCGLGSTG